MENKVIYNFDPSHLSSVSTRGGRPYELPINKEHVLMFVQELANRSVDTFALCPTCLGRKLWDSREDHHWTEEAPYIQPPPNRYLWEWDDKAYFRIRDYMLSGGNPIQEIYDEVRRIGMSFFFSYRMNDCHYLEKTESHIHDTFWKTHPELRIKDYGGEHPNMHSRLANLLLNYMLPEVRQHYLDILTELVESYDVDGLELDFMRKPCLVPYPQREEGRGIITGFVADVRKMLDHFGAQRGKHIKLAVRVPHSVQACWDVAMDVKTWDEMGLTDIFNISTSYIHNMFALDVPGFKKTVKNAKVLGEMHYSMAYAKRWPNYGRKFIRNTTKEMYETTAYYLQSQGADGVTLFNYSGTRQHEFMDPRGIAYPGEEPQLDALDHLSDMDYLETCPKHYFVNRFIVDSKEYPDCAVPAKDDMRFVMKLHESKLQETYKMGALRVETETPCLHMPICAFINGVQLEEYVGTGEFYPPVSIEGLPDRENCRYYRVPVELLKQGDNVVEVHNMQFTHPKEFFTYNCLEMALFPWEERSLMDSRRRV